MASRARRIVVSASSDGVSPASWTSRVRLPIWFRAVSIRMWSQVLGQGRYGREKFKLSHGPYLMFVGLAHKHKRFEWLAGHLRRLTPPCRGVAGSPWSADM